MEKDNDGDVAEILAAAIQMNPWMVLLLMIHGAKE